MKGTVYVTEAGAVSVQGFGWDNSLTGANLRLATALPAAPGRRVAISDFTEASFTGYASQTLTGNAEEGLDPVDGTTYSQFVLANYWQGPTDASGENILGAYVVVASSFVALWVQFDRPIAMRTQYDYLLIQLIGREAGRATAGILLPPD